MLPEEFPVVLTVFLALGAWLMSKQRVLTRKPAAIETLGSATVLCSDKTGTLTQNAVEHLVAKGLRVLGVGKAEIAASDLPDIQHDFTFRFVGLIGLSDPIRENVPEAVAECYRAGIRVIMTTGDYPVTAMNIAREIGLKNSGDCITGQELQSMAEEELCRKIKDINVFARVVPEQKLKIVNA